jgi:acyl carrier protein/RimJ/RimL family protein N-acetyltransferase
MSRRRCPAADAGRGSYGPLRAATPTNMEQESPRIGRRVYLRPVTPADQDLILRAELTPPQDVLYRHRGATPSPAVFHDSLWHGVLAQYIVAALSDSQPLGVVASYDANFRDGHVHLAGILFPPFRNLGWPNEGFELLLKHLFHAFPFRKVYIDALEPNARQFASGFPGLLREEARFRADAYVAGRYVDRLVFAIFREDFELGINSRNRGLAIADELADDAFVSEVGFLGLLEMHFGLSDVDVSSDLVGDLGMDSLAMAELADLVEESVGRAIADEALAEVKSVGDLLLLIRSLRDPVPRD